MPDQTLTLTINAQSQQAVTALRQVVGELGQLSGAQVKAGEAGKVMGQGVSQGANTARSSLQGLHGVIGQVVSALAAAQLARTVFDIGKAAVTAAGEFEQLKVAFTTLLGSAERANAMLAQLDQFAARTPFTLPQVQEGARRLLAMGVAANNVLPALRGIGDAVSATGQASTERLNRVVLAIGQIQTKGKASAEELNQLAEAGIPAYQILEKQLGLTKKQMQDLGNQGISSGRALNAIFAGFSERFGGGMEKQSQTLFGQISNLQDAMTRFLRTAGQQGAGDLAKIVKDLNAELGRMAQNGQLEQWARKMGSAIGEAVRALGELLTGVIRNPEPLLEFGRAIGKIVGELARLADSLRSSGLPENLAKLLGWAADHPNLAAAGVAVGVLALNFGRLAEIFKVIGGSAYFKWLVETKGLTIVPPHFPGDPDKGFLGIAKGIAGRMGVPLSPPPVGPPSELDKFFGRRGVGPGPLPPTGLETKPFHAADGGAAVDPEKAAKAAEILRKSREDFAKFERDLMVDLMPGGTAAAELGKKIADINRTAADQADKLRQEAHRAKIADETRLTGALEAIEQQRRQRILDAVKASEKAIREEREKASRETLETLRRTVGGLMFANEQRLFGQNLPADEFQAQLAQRRVEALQSQTQRPEFRHLRPRDQQEFQREQLQAAEELRRAQQSIEERHLQESLQQARDEARAREEIEQRQAQADAEGLRREEERTAAIRQQRQEADRLAEAEFALSLSVAERSGNVREQVRLIDDEVERLRVAVSVAHMLGDRQDEIAALQQINKLLDDRNKIVFAGLPAMQAFANSLAATVAGIAALAERTAQAMRQGQAEDARFALEQARRIGPQHTAAELQRQLGVVGGRIGALGTPGFLDFDKQAQLRGLREQQAAMIEELRKFVPRWRAFWTDLGHQATQALRSAFTDSLTTAFESLMGAKGKNAWKEFLESLRSIIARSLAEIATEGISSMLRRSLGGVFGTRGATAPRPGHQAADFMGPPPPGVVVDQGQVHGTSGIVKSVPAIAGALAGLVAVFTHGKQQLAVTILGMVSAIVGMLASFAPGGNILKLFGFAEGGEPPVGLASIVGERGPELFIPRYPGVIIPNHRMNLAFPSIASATAGAMPGGLPASITIHQNIGRVDSQVDLSRANEALGWILERGLRTAPR